MNMNKIDFMKIIKEEIEFPLISLLVILSNFIFSELSVKINLPSSYDYILYGAIAIFAVFRLTRIRRIRSWIPVVCLLVYMAICTTSTFKYPGMYDTFVSEFFSPYKYYLVFVILLLPYSYSKNVEDKIRIVEYIFGITVIVVDVFSLINGTQSGITVHKNHLGAMNVALAFIAILNINFKKLYSVATCSIVVLFSAYMTIFAHSRASTLSIGLAIMLFFGYKVFETVKNKKVLILGIICLVAALILVFLLKGDALVSYLFNTNDLSSLTFNEIVNKILNGRADLWGSRLKESMKGDLLLGNGIYSYTRVSNLKGVYLTSVTESVDFLHNLILDAYYSSGIIGLCFFIAFFVSIVIYLKKNLVVVNIRTKRRILLLIILFIHACFDMYFIWDPYTFNFFFFLELGALLNEADRPAKIEKLEDDNQNIDTNEETIIISEEANATNNLFEDAIENYNVGYKESESSNA